ncbi:surface lipoprotein assembly modifier [Pasteurella bettyae]|uniref:surface lipoprotein assembly modifier n=1 Tax=Pasteurella bettyae TaxID=752 RepID=UPI002114F33D|nr:surface lipoprotein assembly modifier [Pasteurella bettyae]
MHQKQRYSVGWIGNIVTLLIQAQAYHLVGTRLGLNHQFDFGLNATVMTLLRRYNYQGYHAALEVTRKDYQQIYIALFKMPQWSLKGFYA